MQDSPPAALIVEEVRKALTAGLAPGFPQKVAANALGIAERELALAPRTSADEYLRLHRLVGGQGDLAARNHRLAEAIRTGSIEDGGDALLDHLIRTTVAKIEVDQPAYPAFRAWRKERDCADG